MEHILPGGRDQCLIQPLMEELFNKVLVDHHEGHPDFHGTRHDH